MKEIVDRYKKEVQAYLNDENEPPVEIALPSVGPDLQEGARIVESLEFKV